MTSRRGDAKTEVTRIATLFEPLLNTRVQLSFAKFSFPLTITAIQLAKLGDMKNKPEERVDEDGKKYRPPVMQITTSDGILYFVVEDITIAAIIDGLRISTAASTIDFRITE